MVFVIDDMVFRLVCVTLLLQHWNIDYVTDLRIHTVLEPSIFLGQFTS